MWKYFSYVTVCKENHINQIRESVKTGDMHPREAKDLLAKSIVTRFIGEDEADYASEEFTRIFTKKELPSDIPEIVLSDDIGLLNLMVKANLATSNGEARRLIKQGAVRIDDLQIKDEKLIVSPKDGMIIRSGKRGYVKVKV